MSARRIDERTGEPYVTVSFRISGEPAVSTWQVMCAIEGLQGGRLAHRLIGDAIEEAGCDPGLAQAARHLQRAHGPQLRLMAVREDPEAG